jgi:hypothetical protein
MQEGANGARYTMGDVDLAGCGKTPSFSEIRNLYYAEFKMSRC